MWGPPKAPHTPVNFEKGTPAFPKKRRPKNFKKGQKISPSSLSTAPPT